MTPGVQLDLGQQVLIREANRLEGLPRANQIRPKTSVKAFRYKITKNMVEPLLLLGAPGRRGDQDTIGYSRCLLASKAGPNVPTSEPFEKCFARRPSVS